MDENIPNADPDLAELSFEQALNRLEETVKSMEMGGLTLLETTRLYEQGMKLARVCSDMIASAELRISRIQTTYGQQKRFLEEDDDSVQEGESC